MSKIIQTNTSLYHGVCTIRFHEYNESSTYPYVFNAYRDGEYIHQVLVKHLTHEFKEAYEEHLKEVRLEKLHKIKTMKENERT